MNTKLIFIIILFSTIWFSCEKDLDITDFKDEFGNYQPELKIEGLLQQDKPKDSIIRIIKTSSITDTDVYNGCDDDGDGEVDEYDEILALVQDTSATVTVTNLNSGVHFDFEYIAVADSFINWEDDEKDNSNNKITMVPYGGYKPTLNTFKIESNVQYKLEIYSKEFDQTITGVTTTYPAIEFIDTLYTFQDSIVTMNNNDNRDIFWKSDLKVTSYYISFDEIILISENERKSEFIDSYISSRDNDLGKRYKNSSIGHDIIWWAGTGTIIKMTVEALSPEYGHYIFSSLPLKDPQRSNLRDQDGDPVMGCFGATAANSIYIVIEE